MSAIDCFVSVVAPLHDDGDVVVPYLQEVTATLARHYRHYEVVLVDDGSADDTVARVSEALHTYDYIRLLRLSKRFGTETAILAGLEASIGDYVVVMMPDTDPTMLVSKAVEIARRGSAVVTGVRRTRSGDSFVTRRAASLFYWYCNRILRFGLPPDSTNFRVLSRQAVNAVVRIKDHLRHFRMYTASVGFSGSTFPYDPVSRRGVPTCRTFWESVKLSVGVIIASSTHPLRIVSLAGVAAAIVNAAYCGYVLLTYFLVEDVAPGWATQSLQSAVMFFFLFLTQAVLCEYVGRILQEGRDRPHYYVLEERNSSVMDDGMRRNVVAAGVDGAAASRIMTVEEQPR